MKKDTLPGNVFEVNEETTNKRQVDFGGDETMIGSGR